MKILVIDIGGTFVKALATGETERKRFASSKTLTPGQMIDEVGKHVAGWTYDVVAIGYPGVVINGQPAVEPRNLGTGWVGFDYAAALGRPVKILNDAAMQALGSYRGGVMLFLGFGTGLGSALVANSTVIPMELGRLSYRDSVFEDYVGLHGLRKHGADEWHAHVAYGVDRLVRALLADDIVLGGGNARLLRSLPPKCRLGDNANAFIGGYRMWETTTSPEPAGKERYTVPTTAPPMP